MKSYLLFFIVAGFLVSACSEQKERTEGPDDTDQVSVHPEGWLDPADSVNFHGKKIESAGWSFAKCTPCHGADYEGGIAESACTKCHPGTPEACGTCHGGGENAAPPRDLAGESSTSARGVGAHQRHVREGGIARAFDCSECHVKPSDVADTGHIDSDLPAEVTFGGFARGDGTEKGSKAVPAWESGSLTCRNTYCHGAFTNGNQGNQPVWTSQRPSSGTCGTCHGLPPSAPHVQVDACNVCHPKVVDKDRVIANRSLHMNGKVEIF